MAVLFIFDQVIKIKLIKEFTLKLQLSLMHSEIRPVPYQLHLKVTNQANHTTQSLTLSVPYYGNSREIKINQAIQVCERKGFLPRNYQLFYGDFAQKINVYLGESPFHFQYKIKTETLINSTLFLIYRQTENLRAEMQGNQSIKIKKVKQRTIGEAMKMVKIWRQLYDTTDDTGKRSYTLEEAAREIGMAKKTLDDYFNHIRIAINHKFDFTRFEEHKVGLLRKFVKSVKENNITAVSQFILDNDTDKYWMNFT